MKCRLHCRYSPQNIFNRKNFNPHNKPISLLNVPICTQGMQRTWWPEAGTIIVTGPYYLLNLGQLWKSLWMWFTMSYLFAIMSNWWCFYSNKCCYEYCHYLIWGTHEIIAIWVRFLAWWHHDITGPLWGESTSDWLDLIFTNNANYIHSFTSNITPMSDHHILDCHTVYDDNVHETYRMPPKWDWGKWGAIILWF